MRRFVILLAVLLIASNMMGRVVTKHQLDLGCDFDYFQNNGGDSDASSWQITIPEVNYKHECKPADFIKFYLHADLFYYMTKYTYDGTTADNMPKTFGFVFSPKIKFYLPNNLYTSLELPFTFTNYNPDTEDIDGTNSTDLSVNKFVFGMSNQLIEQHLLTPWNKFSDGYNAYIWLQKGLYSKVGDAEAVTAGDSPTDIGFAVDYAFLKREMNLMFRPLFIIGFGIAPEGHEPMNIDFALEYAQDFTEQFNINAKAGFNLDRVSSDDDMTKSIDFDVTANYYILPSLLIHVDYTLDLTLEDIPVGYGHPMSFGLGLVYRFDFLNM